MPYYPERKPEPSGEKQRNTTAAEKRNRLLRLSVAAFFSLLVLYGAIRLFRYQSELNESRKTTAELRRIQNPEEIKTESTDLPVPKAGCGCTKIGRRRNRKQSDYSNKPIGWD